MDFQQRYLADQLRRTKIRLGQLHVHDITSIVCSSAIALYKDFLAAQDLGCPRQMLRAQKAYDALITRHLRTANVKADVDLLHALEDAAMFYLYAARHASLLPDTLPQREAQSVRQLLQVA